MGQGIWGDVLSAVGAIPAIGGVVDAARGTTQAIEGKNPSKSFAEMIPGYGVASAAQQLGVSGPSSGGSGADKQTQDILNAIKGYSYEQEMGSGASTLAKQLASQLAGMPAADAEKIMKQLTGTTLGSDITSDIAGPSTTTSQSPYGFDPLSLGTIFSQTMAPWLKQQQGFANTENASLAKQMQQGLSGASPAMQQALGGSIPQMEAANAMMNQASTNQIASAPQWDSFISQLTNATQAAKLAQAEARAEPYWAQTTGSGAAPTTGQYGTAQNTLNALQQQILGGIAGSH